MRVAAADRDRIFAEVCSLIEDRDRAWLGASPEHETADHILRLHEGFPWLSIDWASGDVPELLSASLSTEVVVVQANDENRMWFVFRRLVRGDAVRDLHYVEDAWSTVLGVPEPWEKKVFFSPELMASYRQHAPPEEVDRIEADRTVVKGLSIPWACDWRIVAQIVETLALPYEATSHSFPSELRRHLIRGSM